MKWDYHRLSGQPTSSAASAAALFRQFLRFVAVGAAGTAIQYLVLWLGVEFGGFAPATASGAGYVLGAAVNYVLNYLFTFRSNQSHRRAASRYFALLAVGWCLNTVLMWILVNDAGWQYWRAQVLATGLGLIWNFLGSRCWAFHSSE